MFDASTKIDYRHVLLKITHMQVTVLSEALKLFENNSLAPIATRFSGKTLNDPNQPTEASFANLSHNQKLEFR